MGGNRWVWWIGRAGYHLSNIETGCKISRFCQDGGGRWCTVETLGHSPECRGNRWEVNVLSKLTAVLKYSYPTQQSQQNKTTYQVQTNTISRIQR